MFIELNGKEPISQNDDFNHAIPALVVSIIKQADCPPFFLIAGI